MVCVARVWALPAAFSMNPAQLLSATVTGSGPATVVFGNGFATTQRVWDQLAAVVPPHYRIVRFDFVGTTPANTGHWIAERYEAYDGHADDLVRLLALLDVQNAVFVGHSMSGMISALAARRAPGRLAHLFMIGASACYRRDDDYNGGYSAEEIDDLLRRADADLGAWMGGFGPLLIGVDAPAHVLQEYLATLLAMRPDIGRTMLHSIFTSDYRTLLPEISASVTVVQNAHDVAVPVSAGAYLAQHTRSTGFHVLDVSGHLPHVTHPQLVAPLLRDVLTAHAASAVLRP